jgi:hypothetical protein
VTDLERHHRRLLALYPRDHRERHGEEMLDVLISRGRADRLDTVDLLWNAFRLHLRRMVAADGGIDPMDVLSIVARLGPIALLTGAMLCVHEVRWWARFGALREISWWYNHVPDAPVWAVWTGVAVFGLLDWRRTAMAGAWLGTAGFVFLLLFATGWRGVEVGWLLLGALTACALMVAPARKPVGTRTVVLLIATTLGYIFLGVLLYGAPEGNWVPLTVLVVGAVAAFVPGTRAGRRAALVLLVPVMTTLLTRAMPLDAPHLVAAVVISCVPLVVLLMFGGLPRRIPQVPGEAT